MTEIDNLIVSVVLCGIAVLAVVYALYVAFRQQKVYDVWAKEYNDRKQAFWIKMPQRQRDMHYEMKGASDLEKFMVLEARIHELERQLRNQQDDGK